MKSDSLLTIPELMELLKVKRNTIYTLRKLGLPTIKIGRSVRFRAESVWQWLSEMEKKEPSMLSSIIHKENSHLL